MGIVVIYSEKIESEFMPTSRRFGILLQFPLKILQPKDVEVDEILLELHGKNYLENVKNHPLFNAALENIRCIVSAVEALKENDIGVAPVTAAGHLAEKERMRGSCLFNGLAAAVKLLKSEGKVAVIETDAHHGNAALLSPADMFFCIGNRECKISDDLRCVLGRRVGKGYVESLRQMVEKVRDYNPSFVVWYLGTDIDSREYAEMKIGQEEWDEIMEAMYDVIHGRKALILLASGSREDVLRDVVTRLIKVMK